MKLIPIILSAFLIMTFSRCNTPSEKSDEQQVLPDTLVTKEMKTETVNEPVQEKELHYETYCNSRYGFCIDYPKDLLIPQGESGSGDGQNFTSANGQNTLSVYRDFNDMIDPDTKFSIKAEYEHDLADMQEEKTKRDITYKKSGTNFFVISGYEGDQIFYQKSMLTEGQLTTCILTYNKSEKEVYNKVSERVFQSFK